MAAGPLRNGSRVAVLGGGPAGACAAAALLSAARRLGRLIEVTLYHSSVTPDDLAEPLVIDDATRARLALLGMEVPPGLLSWYRGTVFHAAHARSPAATVPRPVWIVTPGAPAAAFRRLLRGVAGGLGARSVPSAASVASTSRQSVQIRSRGLVQSVELALGAEGVRSPESRGADGLRAPDLHPGGGMWLRAPSPLPERYASHLFAFATPPALPWLFVVPFGARLYVRGGAAPELLLASVARLQRDGLLPLALSVDQVWQRPWHAAPGGVGRDPVWRIGEIAGPFWPLDAFGIALVQSLRLAEDLLAVPSLLSPGEHHLARSRTAQRAALDRLRALDRLARIGTENDPAGRTAYWLLGGGLGAPPAVLSSGGFLGAVRAFLRRVWVTLRGRTPAPAPRIPGKRRSVLVVDDDPEVCSLIAGWLAGKGVRALILQDELSILARAARERPAAIVLDVVLGHTDGFSLLAALARDPATRSVPIVVVSGADLGDASSDGRAYAFLRKPLDLRQLWDLLRPLVAAPRRAVEAAGA